MTDEFETQLHALTITPEQAVIAAIMVDSRVLRFAVTEVDWKDFGDTRLGVIFRGMTLMVGQREPIDVLTISAKLREWEVRGISETDLHLWITALPTARNVDYYAGLVKTAAIRRGGAEIATRLTQEVTTREPSWAIANAMTSLEQLRDGAISSGMQSKKLVDVLAIEDTYDWVIEDLLERQDRVMLTGFEGLGKSTLVRQMAICSAAGLHPFTFRPMPPVRVLVVDTENSERQWRRAARPIVENARLHNPAVDPAVVLELACEPRIDLSRDRDLGRLHRLVDETAPDIVFIGPLYRLVKGSINSDEDAGVLLAALDTLRDRGVALVIEAHAGHATDAGRERDLRPRGSSALMGWPEFGLGLRVNKNAARETPVGKEFQLIRWRADRDARDWPTLIAKGQQSGFPWSRTYPGGTR